MCVATISKNVSFTEPPVFSMSHTNQLARAHTQYYKTLMRGSSRRPTALSYPYIEYDPPPSTTISPQKK